MAKLAPLAAAVLVALMSVASATIYTTTTTTIDEEEEAFNPGPQQECEREIQGHEFKSCKMYLSPQKGSPGHEFLELMNQMQYLLRCCSELQGVKDQCRCEAIKHIIPRQSHQPQQQQVYQRARVIPQYCRFRPCQFAVI